MTSILSGRGICCEAAAVSLTPSSEQYAQRCAASKDAVILADTVGGTSRTM